MKATNTKITSSSVQIKHKVVKLSNDFLEFIINPNGAVRRNVDSDRLSPMRHIGEYDEIYDSGMDVLVNWIKKKLHPENFRNKIRDIFKNSWKYIPSVRGPWSDEKIPVNVDAIIWRK
jgi:hypothetical protein